ncbi:MAG: NAD(P)-dependent oxidoreductase [Candidatus Micrarchaeota archaeon]
MNLLVLDLPVLVIGGSGLVGHALYQAKGVDAAWRFTYNLNRMDGMEHLDATDLGAVERMLATVSPATIILPAAMSDVNRCETDPASLRINTDIVENVITSAKRLAQDPLMVFFSSDYIFDGKSGPYSESDTPCPINAYGRMKLGCEKLISSSGFRHLIIRTSGIFGWEPQEKNFVYRVLKTLRAGKELILPSDQSYTPTYAKDLACAIRSLSEKNAEGVFHVCGAENIGRVSFAKRIASVFGLDGSLISGRPTSSFKDSAPRPLRAGLRTCRKGSAGVIVRGITDALEDMKRMGQATSLSEKG